MMTDDHTLHELHDMARKVGLYAEWFQDHLLHPHYDLVESKRKRAIALGAISLSGAEMVKRCSRLFTNNEPPAAKDETQ